MEKRKPRYVEKKTPIQREDKEQEETRIERPPPSIQPKKRSYVEKRQEPEELCLICSENIKSAESIWTCTCCYKFMHLKCIKKWIDISDKEKNKKKLKFNWTCPQCMFEYCQPIPEYFCFCGKFRNPEPQPGIEPHSCGSYCEKKRGFYCEHPCPDLCHRGRCKPCNRQGVEITCSCGKSHMKIRCSDEKQTFVCGKKCQKPLNCSKHTCNQNCHEGFCNPCSYKHLATCFCGRNESVIDCVQESYQCQDTCGKMLDCGKHTCQEKCHKGACKGCDRKPQSVKKCPCGQYQVEYLLVQPRTSCSDPIPLCGMPCKKTMVCGHKCAASCHEGRCPPCKIEVTQKCRCQYVNRKAQCWQLFDQSERFTCQKVCKHRKSCGQHLCNKECCEYRTSANNFDHPCMLVCQKQLNCGKHTCGMACHSGNCGRCPVLYSQPQPCPCGRTFLRAPVLCGTIVPECENSCGKTMECGHICHDTCHYGECKCYEKVIVVCQCGKNKVETTCGRQVLCTQKCDKLLSCAHVCGRQCHKGDCFDTKSFDGCSKPCNKIRESCGHRCNQRCHINVLCTDIPCRTEMSVKCECGNRVRLMECGSTNLKIEKHIQCNKTCENLKRFGVLYKEKGIYYPPNLVYFGMKNMKFLQKVEDSLERFIKSDQHSLHIDFSRFSGVNNAKIQFSTLFQKHYYLDVTFFSNKKSTFFTLATTKSTMIPQPVLSKYIDMLERGEIKKNSVPFSATIKFTQMPKQKVDLIENAISHLAHHYYSERKEKYQYLHFWLTDHAEQAVKSIKERFPSLNTTLELTEVNTDENEIIDPEEIIEQAVEKKPEDIQEKTGEQKEPEKPQNQPNQLTQENQQSPSTVEQNQPTGEQPADSPTKKQQEPQKSQKSEEPPKEAKKPDILLKKNKYPPAEDYVQTIYELDDDQLYQQNKDWDEYVDRIAAKQLGILASQWRIRSLMILRALHNLRVDPTEQLLTKLFSQYKEEQTKAKRILSLRNVEAKRTKDFLLDNDVVISGRQPEMVSYYLLVNTETNPNTLLTEELRQTMEISTVNEMLHCLDTNNHQGYFKMLKQCDYMFACALLPFLKKMRLESINQIVSKTGGRVENIQSLYEYLFFDSEDEFIDFLRSNKMKISTRQSKKLRKECWYISKINQEEEQQIIESTQPGQIRKSKNLLGKRDVKYAFEVEPEQLYLDKYCLKSYYAFGDYKAANSEYENLLVRSLRKK